MDNKLNKILKDLNPTATLFANSYQRVYNETYTDEYTRDLVRAHLHDGGQEQFPYGHRGTVLVGVIHEMLIVHNYGPSALNVMCLD